MNDNKGYAKEIREENLNVVNELLGENEKLEFFITGYNVDSIYARAASLGAGAVIGGYEIMAGYPTNNIYSDIFNSVWIRIICFNK